MLQSVTKDIMMGECLRPVPNLSTSLMFQCNYNAFLSLYFAAVKEAAVQRRHNLYRDSMVLTNSDPNLHLLGDETIDWGGQFGGVKSEKRGEATNRKRKQIVSMINIDGMPLPYESCQEVPGIEGIPEENEGLDIVPEKTLQIVEKKTGSPDKVNEIRHLINPVLEVVEPAEKHGLPLTNGVLPLEEGNEVKHITVVTETLPPKMADEDSEMRKQTLDELQSVSAIESAIQQIEIAIQEDPDADIGEFAQTSSDSSPRHHDDSGFQSPANENVEEVEAQPITDEKEVDAEQVVLTLVETPSFDLDSRRDDAAAALGKKPEVNITGERCLL